MARLVPLYLDTQAYGIVLGAAEVSTHLLKKPWGHGACSRRIYIEGLYLGPTAALTQTRR